MFYVCQISLIHSVLTNIYVNDNHYVTVDVEDAVYRSSDDEFSKQEKVKVLEKSKGYMYILFILRALLIFYTRIQYL